MQVGEGSQGDTLILRSEDKIVLELVVYAVVFFIELCDIIVRFFSRKEK